PFLFFFSSRRRHTRFSRDWSSDVCSSDLAQAVKDLEEAAQRTSGAGSGSGGSGNSSSSGSGGPVDGPTAETLLRPTESELDEDKIGRASCRKERRTRRQAAD